MLNDWFYSHSNGAVILAICTFFVVVALAGLFVFHRLVDWHAREEDTSMVGLSYALAGGIYAVVIAFVAVGVYEAMDKSAAIAAAEANSLSSLIFDSAGLPPDLGSRVRAGVNEYIDTVTEKEWPRQQAYDMKESNFEDGWRQLRELSLALASYDPQTMGQATVKREMVHDVDDLFSQRRARLLAANQHLPDAIWQMMLCGLVLIAFYVYLFGPHSFALHMACTGLTMVSIGLVMSLIVALDYPFRGDLSVDDEAYTGVKQTAALVFAPPGAAHGEHKSE